MSDIPNDVYAETILKFAEALRDGARAAKIPSSKLEAMLRHVSDRSDVTPDVRNYADEILMSLGYAI